MTYINNQEKEDLQNDTFTLIAELILDATLSLRDKDPYRLHSNLDAIYVLVWSKMNPTIEKQVKEALETMSDNIYGTNTKDTFEMSTNLEKGRDLFKLLTKELKEMDLLFKISVDPKDMVAR